MTRCGGTLQRSGASGERHVCNSALNEYNSILEPCHINLRTTREHLSAPPNDFPQCTRDKLCQPKQAIDPSHCQKPTCDLYRQANQCGCGIHQRAQNKSRQDLQLLSETHVDSEWKHTHHDALRSIEKRPVDLQRGIAHPNEVSILQATTSKFVQRECSTVLVEKRTCDQMIPLMLSFRWVYRSACST